MEQDVNCGTYRVTQAKKKIQRAPAGHPAFHIPHCQLCSGAARQCTGTTGELRAEPR